MMNVDPVELCLYYDQHEKKKKPWKGMNGSL